ncbi:8479_t:CDS:2, partial [Gigaspora margarita]
MKNKKIHSNKEQFLASNDNSINEPDNSIDTFIVDGLSEDKQSNIIRKFDSNDTSDKEEFSDFYELQFLIKWIGWSTKYNSWVDEQATEAIKKYWDYKNKSKSLKTNWLLKKRTKFITVLSTKKKHNSFKIRKNIDKSSNNNIKLGLEIQKFLEKKEKDLIISFYLESSSSDEEIKYLPELDPHSQTQKENTKVISFYENPDLVYLEE